MKKIGLIISLISVGVLVGCTGVVEDEVSSSLNDPMIVVEESIPNEPVLVNGMVPEYAVVAKNPIVTMAVVDESEFKDLWWGMSMEELIHLRGEPDGEWEPSPEHYTLAYKDSIMIGIHSFWPLYHFKDNQLMEIHLDGNFEYGKMVKYVEAYEMLNKIYTQRYGIGEEERSIYRYTGYGRVLEEVLGSENSEIGSLLEEGTAALETRWNDETTGIMNVVVKIMKGSDVFYNQILYRPVELDTY